MAAGCAQHPEWLRATREIAERCEFVFPFGKPQFPAFKVPDGSSKEFLRHLVRDGLKARYTGRRIISDTGTEVPLAQVRAQVEEELGIIADVGYEDYFLITWDFLQDCRGATSSGSRAAARRTAWSAIASASAAFARFASACISGAS
jgi:DNA polymerase III alpha subunit